MIIHSFIQNTFNHPLYVQGYSSAAGNIQNKWRDWVPSSCFTQLLMDGHNAYDNHFHLFVVTFICCLLSTTCLYSQRILAERLKKIQCKPKLSAEENNFKRIFTLSLYWLCIQSQSVFNNVNEALGSKSTMNVRLKESVDI